MWFSSNSQSQICLEKVSWILTHFNWKRILVKMKGKVSYEELSDAWQWDLDYESRALIEAESHWNEYDQKGSKVKELRELLGLEAVSWMNKKSRLRWFGHVERKDDNDYVKRCITWEVEGIRQRGQQMRTCNDRAVQTPKPLCQTRRLCRVLVSFACWQS